MDTEIKISTGNPYPLGGYVIDGTTVNLAVVLNSDAPSGVFLYNTKTKSRKKICFRESNRIGNIYCVIVSNIKFEDYEYTFYSGDKEFCDPYGRIIIGNEHWGKTPKKLRAAFMKNEKVDGYRCPIMKSYVDSVFYLLHVRGFTKHKSSGVTYPGTFSGIVEKIPYLKQLGITTVEIMPAYEFIELAQKEECEPDVVDAFQSTEPKLNYWGYKEGYYFAPKSSYAEPGVIPALSFHRLVEALHDAKMELIMQFYFPTGVKQAFILDVLKYWVHEYHVDGFHLCGDKMPLALLGTDPMLANTKLIYYGFPTDEIYGQSKPNYKNLAVSNDDYMYNIRRFLKSDEAQLKGVLSNMKWNDKKLAGIHYITNSNGFTLKDLVSYDRKHNEENGENDRDGNPYNASWNCGYEGQTSKTSVNKLRHKQMKNAILFNMLSQSTPMILSGDEFGNSQKGNNNPYCIDSPLTWLNWNDINKHKDIYEFYKASIEFRRQHKILYMPKEYRMTDYLSCGFPDLSYHSEEAWKVNSDDLSRHFSMLYTEGYAQVDDNGVPAGALKNSTYIFVAVNMHWSTHTFALPNLRPNRNWYMVMDTGKPELFEPVLLDKDKKIIVRDRSIVVLLGK